MRDSKGRFVRRPREIIKCKCECGTDISNYDKYGRKREFKQGHHINIKNPNGIRESHNNWKGGKRITNSGYIHIRVEGHPRAKMPGWYIFEHVFIMEQYLGRYLNKDEIIHHKNGIKTDNRIENLQLMDRKEHQLIHHKGRKKMKS